LTAPLGRAEEGEEEEEEEEELTDPIPSPAHEAGHVYLFVVEGGERALNTFKPCITFQPFTCPATSDTGQWPLLGTARSSIWEVLEEEEEDKTMRRRRRPETRGDR